MNEPKTIDLTPTWEGTMRVYMAVLENPKAEAHSLAAIRADLLRLARWVDKRYIDCSEGKWPLSALPPGWEVDA